jgi:L-malate glycosyltransferase
MKKIVVAGYYGFRNSGDDAILHSICNDILKLSSTINIMVLSKQPEITMAEYPVKAINRFCLKDVIREIRSCDVLVMGGGSLIQDVTSTRSLYYYLGLLIVAKIFRKASMLYGNGIGPIIHGYNKPLISCVLNRVNIITLREHLSKEILLQLKVKKPKISVTADPVFNLQLQAIVDTSEIYSKEGIPKDKPLVGVLFRSWNHEESYTRKMAKVCDQIIETYGYHIVFIPMTFPGDLTVASEMMKRMEHKASVIQQLYNEEKLIGFMGELRLILSMRLHGLIYGALKHVPIIGFNYDPKVEYYAKELDIPIVEDMQHIHVDKIMRLIETIEHNRESVISQMEVRVNELKQEAKRNREYLSELL